MKKAEIEHFSAGNLAPQNPIVIEEAERLYASLRSANFAPGLDCSAQTWTREKCLEIAPLTLEINRLKKEKNAVIVAHSYVVPEIVYGVADLRGDSYGLALEAKNLNADVIVFAGVSFMAETAKMLAPQSQVLLPDRLSGCSLADSLNGEELRALKEKHPRATVVCYINSTAEVKAESDVCVTSSNVLPILMSLESEEILFVPDKLMAQNMAQELSKRGVHKKIISSEGTCEVHDRFASDFISKARYHYPGLKVVSHPECTTDVVEASDFVGSTGTMMEYVKKTKAPYFLMATECGLVSRLEVENPEKKFIGGCQLCPHMKRNSLEKIYLALTNPSAEQIITVDPEISNKALRSIDRMFELSQNIQKATSLS